MVQAWAKRGWGVRWRVGLGRDGRPQAVPHRPMTAVSWTFSACPHDPCPCQLIGAFLPGVLCYAATHTLAAKLVHDFFKAMCCPRTII